MKDGQGLVAAWCTHSDLPLRCREGYNVSLTECHESPQHVFPQELSHLDGPNFLVVDVLLVMRDAIFWDVSRDFLRFCQRADPLVVDELLRGRVLLLLQEHQLRIEQEAALFQQVSRGPLDREDVKVPEQAPCLASSCEGDKCWTRGTNWRQFDVGQRSDACFAPSLLPHRAPRQFVSPSFPSDSGRLSTLRAGGMSRSSTVGCGLWSSS